MDTSKKDSSLMLVLLFSWAGVLFYFNPRLLALLIGPEPWTAKLSVVLFILTLDFLWLIGIYHLTHILFSWNRKRAIGHECTQIRTNERQEQDFISPKSQSPIRVGSCGFGAEIFPNFPVAILYMTKDDFNEKACLTCLEQHTSGFHVFLCDDSQNPEIQNRIRLFSKAHPGTVTHLPRVFQQGFKAGNINHALSKIDPKYTHVLVTDADCHLPPDFISRIMPHFHLNPSIAFVQSLQLAGDLAQSDFARDTDYQIDLHYRHYVVNKNRYGHVMWYGHGAILRRDVIQEVGGIPEVVTEDLSFSSEIRRLGYQGIVAEDVFSFEGSPVDPLSYRVRQRKWVRGTFEYLMKYFPRLWAAPKVPWFEKADILISAMALLQAFPFFVFIFLASFVLPYHYSTHEIRGPWFLIPPVLYDHWYQSVLGTRYNVFWSWDFYFVMMTATFFPLLPALFDLWKKKGKMLRFFCMSTFVYLSLIFDSAKEFVLYGLTRKNHFPVTGDAIFLREKWPFLWVEFLLGPTLTYHALTTYNLWLLALSFAMITTPLWLFLRQNLALRIVASVPFAVSTTVCVLVGVTLIQQSLMR